MSSTPIAPEATIVLKDGSTVAVRGLAPADEPALAAFYGSLSPESQAFRFFAAPADVGELAKRLVISDYESQFGPTRRMPDCRHTSTRFRCSSAPSAPDSAKPGEMTTSA